MTRIRVLVTCSTAQYLLVSRVTIDTLDTVEAARIKAIEAFRGDVGADELDLCDLWLWKGGRGASWFVMETWRPGRGVRGKLFRTNRVSRYRVREMQPLLLSQVGRRGVERPLRENDRQNA